MHELRFALASTFANCAKMCITTTRCDILPILFTNGRQMLIGAYLAQPTILPLREHPRPSYHLV